MVILSPGLAYAMLNVWDRRKRHPKGTTYASSLLDSALYGKPDFTPELPNFVRRMKARQDSPRQSDTAWLNA